jgi:hypothetical protein
MEHRRCWRRAVWIALTSLCVSAAWAQNPAPVGPVRIKLSAASSTTVPNGTSVKLNLLKTFFSNTTLTSGTRNISGTAVWTSSDPTVFTVSSHGLATAVAATGTATITATVKAPGWGAQLTILLAAGPAALQFITFNHFNSSVGVGSSLTYIATGHYSDGTTPDVSGSVTWGVVNNINGTTGTATHIGAMFTGQTAGIVEVTATSGSITGATFLNVGLSNLSITPLSPAILPQKATQAFLARGDFPGLPGFDVTSYVHWTSSDSTIARMSNGSPTCPTCGGVATGIMPGGPVNINAVSGTLTSNTVALTVGPVAVISVAISAPGCDVTNVPRGTSCQFVAVAKNSDQSTTTVTSTATWNSDNGNCAAVGSTTGLATTLSSVPNPCTANITATVSRPSPYNDTVQSLPTGMTVTAHALKSISISPVNPSKPFGTPTVQFTAKGHYTDGIIATIPNGTAGLSWSSSNTSVATIGSTSGLASVVAQGTTTIGATYVSTSTFNASTKLTVTAPTLSNIQVTALNPVPTSPPSSNVTIPIAGTQQFQAVGTYTDNSQADITSAVTWNSSVGATISNTEPTQGLATGVSAGTPSISGTLGSVTSNLVPLTVITISSITVSPSPVTINIGQTQTFTATANYGGGVTQLLTAFNPAWSSNHTNVATVDQSGVASAVAGGSATIAATLGSVACVGAGCGSLTVNQPILMSITVACDPDSPCATSGGEAIISLSQTQQMIATGNYSDGSTQDLTQLATWNSTNTSVATITTGGLVTGKAFGSTDITAKCTNGGACPGATSTVTGTLPLTVSF